MVGVINEGIVKKILITILLLISYLSDAQTGGFAGMSYGLKGNLTMDFFVSTNTKEPSPFEILYGGGISIPLATTAKGVNYSATMGPNRFPKEIYERVVKDDASLYGIFGVKYSNVIVGSKIGWGFRSMCYNAFDDDYILSNSGYYYTTTTENSPLLVGGFIGYRNGAITPIIGYDTFNGLLFGVSASF